MCAMFVRVAPPVLVAPLWILFPSACRTSRPVAAYTSGYTTLVFHVARFLTGRIAICCKTRASYYDDDARGIKSRGATGIIVSGRL